MVGVIPLLDKVGMDFLNTDCMLENPLLTSQEGCACFRIKYPREEFLNNSHLPPHLTQNDVLDVYILRNSTQFDADFSLSKFIQFPSKHNGMHPFSCHEISGLDKGMYGSDEFYQEAKMMELLSNGIPWSFSWYVIM